jgi:hypothetical protein
MIALDVKEYFVNKPNLLLVFFLILSFTSCQIIAEDSKGISPKDLRGEEIRVDRSAEKKSGHFLGLKGQAKLRKFNVTECSFTYEKGTDSHPQSSRDYKFERFMINFSGVDKKGENSFDSVTYGHSDYKRKFKGLDFSKGFDFKEIKRVELPEGQGVGKLKASRNDLGELSMTFRHKEAYSTGNSSFFVKGEIRDYKVSINFSRFDSKNIKLKSVRVKATQRLPHRSRKLTTLVDVNCSDFKQTEEE